MNFRKPISVAAAAAVGISMVAVSVSAATIAITTDDANAKVYDGGIQLNITTEEKNYESEGVGLFTQAGLDQTSVYGFRIKLTPNDNLNLNGSGGCIAINSNSTGWKAMDWANADAGKAYSFDENFVITYTSTSSLFKSSDKYCQVHIQEWWGDPINVESIELLDKDGNVIDYVTAIAEKKAADEAAAAAAAEEAAQAETEAAPAEDATAEETTAAETEAAPVEEDVEADVEAEDEELEEAFEEDAEEEYEEFDDEAAEEEATPDESFGGFDVDADDNSIQVGGEGTSNNWGQAVVMYTYNNLAEDEEPGDNEFDESLINPDNYIVVYYESDTAPELILQSWSGGEGWAKVPCDEDLSQPGKAVFTYEYMTAMYQSEDLSTLDAVNVGDQGVELKVTGVYVVPKAVAASDDAGVSVDANTETTEETAAADTANTTVSDTSVTSPGTGNVALGSIAAVMAVAGAAAAVAAKKRK